MKISFLLVIGPYDPNVVGSLLAFVTFNWLLGHVSAALVGTYAYVNPMVALVVGWLLGGEELHGWTIGGMLVILTGVTLVRSGVRQEIGKADQVSETAPPVPTAPAPGSEDSTRGFILSAE